MNAMESAWLFLKEEDYSRIHETHDMQGKPYRTPTHDPNRRDKDVLEDMGRSPFKATGGLPRPLYRVNQRQPTLGSSRLPLAQSPLSTHPSDDELRQLLSQQREEQKRRVLQQME